VSRPCRWNPLKNPSPAPSLEKQPTKVGDYERPVFIPAPDAPALVSEKNLAITWAGGFAAVQKKKNVKALHSAAQAIGIGPMLEESTKSDEKLGQHLSAFHLKV